MVLVVGVMGLGWLVTALLAERVVVFNPTGSAPVGLYVRVAVPGVEEAIGYSGPDYRGLAGFVVPSGVANWAARRYPRSLGGFLKPVFGIAGDELCFREGGYYRNGEWFSAALPATASDGTSVPAWTGCRVLEVGEVFVWSGRITDSFDSRSYGPVPVGSIFGVYDPLWTW